MTENTGLEIAVIGMAGRFPGARNIHEFWENLKNGVESISFFTPTELEEAGVEPAVSNHPDYVGANGILDGIDCFDSHFFGYSPREAGTMDPQQRIFHECAWEALEDAGYVPDTYDGLIGLYAGAGSVFSWGSRALLSGKADIPGQFAALQLIDKDFLSLWVSYKLNLKGPAVIVQTACSTSLTAIHMACQAILNGECDMALAGGVGISLYKKGGYLYREGMIASPDGHCRAFDEKAKGVISGNGAGAVVLKRLDEAVKNRDFIYAVVKGSAVNNDGVRKIGFTAPSIEGQAEVILTAQEMAEVEPESITYVEAHGTGTELGDPVEIEALKLAFKPPAGEPPYKKQFCAVGSVKTNIGHLDAAAGVTGFIKTALALHHKRIPPSLHFEKPNPKIDFENSPFYVNTGLIPWENEKYPLRAGVSSFGIGGTNAHIILEEAPPAGESSPGREWQLILLSAKTEPLLDKTAKNLAEFLTGNKHVPIADVAYTLQAGRKPFRHRMMMQAASNNDRIAEALTTRKPGTVFSFAAKEEKPRVIFMFPGQGAQYIDMGLDLYRSEDTFRREMDRCFDLLRALTEVDAKALLYPAAGINRSGTDGDKINQTRFAQPLIFIIQYALARLLMEWGIKPHAMIGHSIGEYAAACLSGVFSLEDALQIVVSRGDLMQRMPPGAMLGVSCSEEEITPLLAPDPGLSLAAVNGPSDCTVSGPHAAVQRLREQLEEKGYRCRPLHTSHAFHSPMMDPILEDFREVVARAKPGIPGIPFISNLTGKWVTPAETADPGYWTKHLRNTVRFSRGVRELMAKENPAFIEIGPGRTLSAFVKKHADNPASQMVLNLVRHPREGVSDLYYLMENIGRLWLYGIEPDWTAFYDGEKRNRVPLPAYPFERKRHRLENGESPSGFALPPAALSTRKNPNISDWFYVPLWKQAPPVSHPPRDGEDTALLVFADSLGIGEGLCEQLKQRGQDVVLVKSGTGFSREGSDVYVVNPSEKSDYGKLFKELRENGEIPRRIVHLWALSGHNPLTVESALDAQDRGFYSLLYLLPHLKEAHHSRRVELAVVTNNTEALFGEDYLGPEHSTLHGALRVIPQENPGFRCRGIDISLPLPQKGRDLLAAEVTADTPEKHVVLRDNRRWVRTYEPHPLPRVTGEKTGLRENGVYLITGGLGNIGLTIAGYLAETVRAKLILTGLSPLPPREEWDLPGTEKNTQKIQKIREIEKQGGEVLAAAVDVADETQMRALLARAEERFGPLDGVIHAAGTLGLENLGPADTLDRAGCLAQFQPKMAGTIVLGNLLKEKKLDFCILMSSLSSFLGGAGFFAYAAANRFLDGFLQAHNRKSDFPWLGVNWDGWQFDPGGPIDLAMTPEEGIETFKRILLHGGEGRLVHSLTDLRARIERTVWRGSPDQDGHAEAGFSSGGHSREYLSFPYTAPVSPVENTLAGIWGQLFGIEKIGIHDNFFELGGDSLKVMTVASAIHKQLGVKIPLTEFFNFPTIEKLARYIDNTGKRTVSTLEPVEKREYYPLSSAQKRLYILHQMENEFTGYNEISAVQLEGIPDKEKIREAAGRLIRRHESLRTSFIMIDNTPVQRVWDNVPFDVEHYRVAEETVEGHVEDNVEDILTRFLRPFDLSRAPLLRMGLVEMAPEKHLLVYDTHHIIFDGTSGLIFLRDFLALYSDETLPPLPIQYKDFSRWQNDSISNHGIKHREAFWLEQFSGDIPVLDLPVDYPRPPVQSFEGGYVEFRLNETETRSLKELALKEGATLYMVLAAAYYILLAGISGREDIVIGVPTAGRLHADLENIIGIFINTLALRNFPAGEKSFLTFLQEIKTQTIAAFENQEYQFEDLVEKVTSAGDRDMSRNPIFDVLFVFQNIAVKHNGLPSAGEERKPGLTFTPYPFERTSSKFDLVLHGTETGDSLSFNFGYCSKLFKEETIRRLIAYFKRIVTAVPQNPERQISGIEIISAEEKQRLLVELNDTNAPYPKDKTVHQLFEEQAARIPDAAALNMSHKSHTTHMTYNELNREAGRLARRLRDNGAAPGCIVGIKMERSLNMIIGIMGILKTGAAYLPIDPAYPQERIDFMLKDSNAKIHIDSCRDAINRVPNQSGRDESRPYKTGSQDPAYVIYTSGSTGRPKGVMIGHASLINFVYSMSGDYGGGFGLSDRGLCLTNFCFDVSVCEIFLPLVFGASLVLLPHHKRFDPGELAGTIVRDAVTFTYLPPGLLKEVYEHLTPYRGRLSLNKMLVGVEPIPDSVLEDYSALHKDMRIVNGYGPTEATICAAAYVYKSRPPEGRRVPIGAPLDNTKIFLLDKHQNPVPEGVPGELHIAGDGLARGYLNNPELTAERFDRSYKSYKTYIFYRTGDLARWLPGGSGNLEFIGRVDNQVKIRGYRVELGEIESLLTARQEIDAAVVSVIESNLCAYVVPARGVPVSVPALRGDLSRRLPDYMVPAYFVEIENIPLTPHGKIDRKALPRPEFKTGKDHVAPGDDIEKALVRIWSRVLDIEEAVIGTHDNFFELGGHSLRAAVVVSRVHREFNIKIPLSEVFKTPTVKALATYIKEAEKEKYTSIPPVEEKEYFPLSPAQKRLYMLQQLEPRSILYNMPVIVILEGDARGGKLEETFTRLIDRHESYRTAFKIVDNDVVQVIYPHVDFEIEYHEKQGTSDGDGDGSREIIDRFVRPFDLSKAPLFRAGLIKTGEKEHILMIDTHHIISDGTSQGLFIRDFTALFAGEGPPPPPLTTRYRDYSMWRYSESESGALKRREAYWLGEFEGDIPAADLPLDFERPTVQSFEGSVLPFEIGGERAALLKEIALREGVSLFVLLLSILDILVAKLTRRHDIVVGTEIAGRSHAELQNIIGLFLNTLALRNFPHPEKSFRTFLKETARRTLEAFENQDYLFEDLVEKVLGKRPVNRNPLFDVMFVWQNMEIKEVRLPGLTLKPYTVEEEKSRALIDLSLYGREVGDTLDFYFEYNTTLFKEETVRRFVTYFKEIVTVVTTNNDVKLGGINVSHDLAMAKVDVFKESDDEFEF